MYDRVFIGDPSQAGKTTLARKVAALSGYTPIQMDHDRLMLRTVRIRFNAPRNFLRRHRGQSIVRRIAPATVVEGHLVTPSFVASIAKDAPTLLAVFVGYPDADTDQTITTIRNSGERKYLLRKERAWLEEWIAENKRDAANMRKECAACGIRFIDLSDLDAIDEILTAAAKDIVAQLTVPT